MAKLHLNIPIRLYESSETETKPDVGIFSLTDNSLSPSPLSLFLSLFVRSLALTPSVSVAKWNL